MIDESRRHRRRALRATRRGVRQSVRSCCCPHRSSDSGSPAVASRCLASFPQRVASTRLDARAHDRRSEAGRVRQRTNLESATNFGKIPNSYWPRRIAALGVCAAGASKRVGLWSNCRRRWCREVAKTGIFPRRVAPMRIVAGVFTESLETTSTGGRWEPHPDRLRCLGSMGLHPSTCLAMREM